METEMEKEKEKEMEMEKEKKKEMENKFSAIHRRLRNLESQLTLIFSKSPETETLPSCAEVSEINQKLHFMKSLLTAEMASNSTQNTGRDEIRHLYQIVQRVKHLQNVCRAWSTPGHTSSYVVSSEAPRCSYTDPAEDYVDEEENELDNYYDDHDEREQLPIGCRIWQNPVFESHDNDQDGSVELGDVSQDDEDLEEKESVTDDTDTEERRIKVEECICDGDQSDEVESEECRIKDTIKDYYDQKDSKTKKAEEDSDDGSDNGVETHYCYRVIFWGGLIGLGIISVMAGFSEFPDHHSHVMLLTPT